MQRDDRYRQLAGALRDSFQRIADTFTVKFVAVQIVRMRAIMTYSKLVHESPILRRILDDCVRKHEDHILAHKELDPESTAALRDVAEGCRTFLDIVPEERLTAAKREEFAQAIEEAWDHPVINGSKLREPMKLFLRCQDLPGTEGLLELQHRMNRALSELKGQDMWFELGDASAPWKGARIVLEFGRAAENVKPRDHSPREVVTARTVHKALNNTGFSWSDFGLLGVQGEDYAYSALSQFHDHVIVILASRTVELDAFSRYADRVMRFEYEQYLDVIVKRKPKTSQDEKELKRRLNIYLHDTGLNPLPEVPSGRARTDALLLADPKVTYEAKVLRPKDRKGAIEKRIRLGLRQAVIYRRHWQLDLAHLVLFNGSNRLVDLPLVVAMEGGLLAIHDIDLGGPPSRHGRRQPVISWSTERVLKEALG